MRNSPAFKFSDIHESVYKISMENQTQGIEMSSNNFTENDNIQISAGAKLNTKYTPYGYVGDLNYNGDSNNGDSGTMVNIFNNEIHSAGMQLSDVIGQQYSGLDEINKKKARAMLYIPPASGVSVFMDEARTHSDHNCLSSGDWSGLGNCIYSGKTHDIINFSLRGLIQMKIHGNTGTGADFNNIYMISRKFKQFQDNKWAFVSEEIILEYDTDGQKMVFEKHFQLGKDQMIYIFLTPSAFTGSTTNYQQVTCGASTGENENAYFVLQNMVAYFVLESKMVTMAYNQWPTAIVVARANESTYVVPAASRLGSNYQPYHSQSITTYNGGLSEGEGDGTYINLFNDQLYQTNYKLDNVLGTYITGTQNAKPTMLVPGVSGQEVFMDNEENINNCLVSGDFSGIGNCIFGGQTYEYKKFTLNSLVQFDRINTSQSNTAFDRVLIISRKFEQRLPNEWTAIHEGIELDYTDWSTMQCINKTYTLARNEMLYFFIVPAIYTTNMFTAVQVGDDDGVNVAPKLSIQYMQHYITQ